MSAAFFFGCWNGLGHFWRKPGGAMLSTAEERVLPFHRWIDTGWAPRRFKPGRFGRQRLVSDPSCCFAMECERDDDRRDIMYDTEEHEQGRFLLHVRNGWTLISWWDRKQGDTRGACNSSFVLQGEHTEAEMVAGLREHFPHVVENLARAGVALEAAK
jgi:hypothetical protein